MWFNVITIVRVYGWYMSSHVALTKPSWDTFLIIYVLLMKKQRFWEFEQGYKATVWLDWDASQASLLPKPTLSPLSTDTISESLKHSRPPTSFFFSCLSYTRRNLNAKQRSFNFMLWMWTIVGIISENHSVYIAKQWVRLYQQGCLGDTTMEFSLSKWAILFTQHWLAWVDGSLVVVDVILLFECWGYFFVHFSQCFLGS